MVKRLLNTYLSDFLSLFYPNLCIGCDRVLPKGGKYLCPKCLYNLPKTRTHELEVPLFKEKFEGLVQLRDILVYIHFHKNGLTQKVLHELKYGNMPDVGEMMGKRYAYDLLHAGLGNAFDLIVPVPLHPKRLKQRGYNQSEYFGKGLSIVLGIPMNTSDLIKVKHIDSQTKKNKLNRIKRVEGVFDVVDNNALRNKRILLVDDLLTTGSTLVACLEVLGNCEPKSMSIATIGGAK